MKPVTVVHPLAVSLSLKEMDFRKLADFNTGTGGVFWSDTGGPSPWEMHPDTDELLMVLDGAIEVEVLPADGAGEKARVDSGGFVVIPRGHWHRQWMLKRTAEFYLTPGKTLMSHADDPRKV